MRVEIEFGRVWGGTTYVNPTWGVNVWSCSPSVGAYRWQGWPAMDGRLDTARIMAREVFERLPEPEEGERHQLSLKARK